MCNSKCNEALGYWTIGIQYLHLVQTVANKMIQQGNKHIILSDEEISLEQYAYQTKWSDFNLIVPLLFNFYHGVEVLLKGFLVAKETLGKKSNHNLTDLLTKFGESFPNHNLNILFARYVDKGQLPEPLASFCLDSSISIDDYYQALKYPDSNCGKKNFKHISLKYRSDKGLEFLNGLVSDIGQIRLDAVTLGRKICPNL